MGKTRQISPARRAAFDILREVEAGAFSSILLATEEPKLKPADRALTHELVLGVLRWQLWLDKLIDHFTKRRVESLDVAVRLALRLGLYQLRFLTRVPAPAAVNESVNLVRSAKVSSAAAFVNAVLRRAIREAEFDPAKDVTDPVEKLAIETSHPDWLIERWVSQFGIVEAEAFARANNRVPPTAFRLVERDLRNEILERLQSADGIVEPSAVAQDGWRVSGASALVRELATQGKIYLQDEASQLVAQTVDLQPGERALDLCAAPGGKTTLMAQRAEGRALIVASDRFRKRLDTVIKISASHNLTSIKSLVLDAAQPLPFENSVFDRILIDAPCSGTGTLRRNPEIRWRTSESDIRELATQQKLFLKHAARVLKPGGQLVYSTCSVERDENEQVIDAFLDSHTDFQLLKTIRTWPHREGTDGFFIASFRLATQQ
ncbi:MAG TPA: 16S rRNA (cytosine(967)-C(5))-methyltransferase RsmB [Pyrinomonadaceae bacterium]|nr:16S rRNA (cytosine(967)-C(5))-methyltransferase RsmB [Pyrinomonadaceae bacterium]